MQKADLGLIGLAVMGQNLALNIADKGFKLCVYNRTQSTTHDFMNGAANKGIQAAFSLQELTCSIQSPKKIIFMVKAGQAVDSLIESIIPLLEAGDMLIDGGNSYYKDTVRRADLLAAQGIEYMGVGISGGEEGALLGPSIMPGGSKEAWDKVKDILLAISAKAADGEACCTYIGSGGSGHFVKMIHNGIEYADMQLISEAYLLLKESCGLNAYECSQVFKNWNDSELNSYLIEITADILGKTDPDTGKPMVDIILDKAGQKGTGQWTSKEALDLGAATPTITEAVFARFMSSLKDDRLNAAKILPYAIPKSSIQPITAQKVKEALYASKICAYAQGFDILKLASENYLWDLDLASISLIWREGCIIRAQFLERIKDAYLTDKSLTNLLLDPYFVNVFRKNLESLRQVVSHSALTGVPIPGLASALSYYDSYRKANLPANLLQAQRDYFGAHTFERIDRAGTFHFDWKKI